MSIVDTLASALRERPHSFAHIRKATGIELSDEQLTAVVRKHPDLFQTARFVQHDADGNRVRPGRPGAKLRPADA